MAGSKTHWKQLHDYNYLGAYMMPVDGADLTLTIKDAKQDMIEGDGGKKDKCCVISFAEKDTKPMIVNATNSRTIEKLYGSPYIEDWIGKKVTLYVAKVKAFGDVMDALRIRDFKPKDDKLNVIKALAKLNAAASLAELQVAYMGLSKDEQANDVVIKLKDDLKAKLR